MAPFEEYCRVSPLTPLFRPIFVRCFSNFFLLPLPFYGSIVSPYLVDNDTTRMVHGKFRVTRPTTPSISSYIRQLFLKFHLCLFILLLVSFDTLINAWCCFLSIFVIVKIYWSIQVAALFHLISCFIVVRVIGWNFVQFARWTVPSFQRLFYIFDYFLFTYYAAFSRLNSSSCIFFIFWVS